MRSLITPLKVAGLIAPILRPLPTIFNYARLTASTGGKSTQAIDDEFHASLRALAETIEAVSRDAGIPDQNWQPLVDKCIELAQLTGEDLAAGLDGFCAGLTDLHKSHGKDLRKAVAAAPEKFRDLYRQAALPKKLLLCYSEERDDQADSLERKLSDRCHYDYVAVEGDWTAVSASVDLLVFAPSDKPIPANLLAIAESYGLPFLILMAPSKDENEDEEMENMALMKAEHLYRKSGYNVLRSPFTPARLYSTIDGICLRHLAGKVLPIPDVKAAAAADRAAAGQS